MLNSEPAVSEHATRVLLVAHDFGTRDRWSAVLRLAGFIVDELAYIEDPDTLPAADVVLVELDQFPLVQAMRPSRAVVVIADEVRDGILACVRGASDWVPRSTHADYLVSTVTAASGG